jgi:hypothetical protein
MPDGTSLEEEMLEKEVSDDGDRARTSAENGSSEDKRATCAVCAVETAAAQSGLHESWELSTDGYGRHKDSVPLRAFEAGSADCLLCGIIVAAVTTWAPTTSQGVQNLLLSFSIFNEPDGHEMEVRIFEPDDRSGDSDGVIQLDIFRMQDKCCSDSLLTWI